MPPRALQLSAIGVLYTTQGLIHGFGLLMVTMLAQGGIDLDEVAPVLFAGALPWVVKFAWAALLDLQTRPNPVRTRWWALVAQLAAGGGLLLMAGMPAGVISGEVRASTLAFTWFLVNTAMSLQDVATDAMILDGVADTDRERAGLAAQIGHTIGAGLLVTGLLYHLVIGVTPAWPLTRLVQLTAAITLATAVAPLAFAGLPEQRAPRPLGPALRNLLHERRVYLGVLLCVIAGLPGPLSTAVSQNFLLQELAWPLADVLFFSRVGIAVAVVLMVAMLVAGTRIAPRIPAIVGGTLIGLTFIAFALSPGLWHQSETFIAVAAIESVGGGLLLAGLYALLMDLTHPVFRAVQFTLWMSLLNVGRAIGPDLGPWIVERWGYPTVYGISGLLYLLVLPLMWLCWRTTLPGYSRTPNDERSPATEP